MSVEWNNAMLPRIRAAAMRGLVAWIGDIEQRAVDKILKGPKTGRIYRRRGVVHRASAPGQSPASDTGRLVNSRRIEVFEEQLRARLTFSTAYAAPLEFGTIKMEARPFLRNSLEESMETGQALVHGEIAAVLK